MTPNTPTARLLASSSIRIAAAVVLAGAFTSQAGAVSLAVKMACASDYYSFCGQHEPGSTGVRQCMRAHGSQLSKPCVDALVSAGEVSKIEVERRRAAAAKSSRSKTASAK